MGITYSKYDSCTLMPNDISIMKWQDNNHFVTSQIPVYGGTFADVAISDHFLYPVISLFLLVIYIKKALICTYVFNHRVRVLK